MVSTQFFTFYGKIGYLSRKIHETLEPICISTSFLICLKHQKKKLLITIPHCDINTIAYSKHNSNGKCFKNKSELEFVVPNLAHWINFLTKFLLGKLICFFLTWDYRCELKQRSGAIDSGEMEIESWCSDFGVHWEQVQRLWLILNWAPP